ncbi:MAG TPA: branched-chain amino acid ABC transporter permease [Actinomycetota bacterium]|nr:branched-chain amino acid ABC transporter permease [Actinomycetota bacterium]
MSQLYIQGLVSGILLGGLFALMALGFSLMWRFLRVINLVHFGMILLAAYLTYQFARSSRLDPWIALVFTIPLFALLGAAVQWVFHRFQVTIFNSLLVAFGMFVIIEGVIRNVWGADFLRIPGDVSPYAVMSVSVRGVALPVARLIAFGVAIPLSLAAAAFLERSYIGKALRAVAEDADVAVAFGVNFRRISLLVAAASGVTGAIAGTLVAVSGTLFPDASQEWIGIVFAVVILGGVGSPTGAVAASILIGAISGIVSVAWAPAAAPLMAFAVLILVLLWRPYGLFGRIPV